MAVPTVATTTPADGATTADIDAAISFQFSTAIDSTSVTSQTIYVFDLGTLEEIDGALTVSSDGKTVTFTPARALFQDRMYAAVAVGLSSGATSYILSGTGDPLADDYRIEFRTAVERYVSLEEAVSRNDGDYIAPIRAVESTLPPGSVATALEISLSSSSPVSFATAQDRCLSTVTLTFSEDINPTGALDALSLETNNVFGMDEYYGAPDGTGDIYTQDLIDRCSPSFTAPNTEPDFTQPTGTFSVSGNTVTWTRGAGEPCFNYNTEVQVIASTDLTSVSGASLAEEAAVIFTTEFWPLFIGSRMVRTHLGPIGRAFMDDTINRVIHRWSIDALEQAAYRFNVDVPYPAVRRYVLYSSIITLIDDLIADFAASGRSRKVLGDLEIEYGSGEDLAKIPIYQEARIKLEKLTRELRRYRGQTKIKGFIKGSNAFDARDNHRQRTWENTSLYHPWSLVPSVNSANDRWSKMSGSYDHRGTTPYIPTTVYAYSPDGVGLFTCPRRS